MSDRIDFITGPWVDDAVLEATSVHIEDLGGKVWIGVNRADGDRFCFEVGPSADSPVAVCLTEGSVGLLNATPPTTPPDVSEALDALRNRRAYHEYPDDTYQSHLATLATHITTQQATIATVTAEREHWKRAAEWLAATALDAVEQESTLAFGVGDINLYWQEYEGDGNTETPASLAEGKRLAQLLVTAALEATKEAHHA